MIIHHVMPEPDSAPKAAPFIMVLLEVFDTSRDIKKGTRDTNNNRAADGNEKASEYMRADNIMLFLHQVLFKAVKSLFDVFNGIGIRKSKKPFTTTAKINTRRHSNFHGIYNIKCFSI